MGLPPLPAPMEARLVEDLPEEGAWSYEPKWDGFRAIAGRDGDEIALLSKSGKPLLRYFPEIGEMLGALPARRFVVDGELILPIGDCLSFDALQQRLHPAESRVRKLARETPAQLMLFDCLLLGEEDLAKRPLSERRHALEGFHKAAAHPALKLSPITRDPDAARDWLARSGGALDGIVAKPLDAPYRSGERAMLKVKPLRSADCIVGGFRRTKDEKGVASLLLGLLDEAGRIDYVGFCSGFSDEARVEMLANLTPLIGSPGFTGKAPGGPSRWRATEAPWEPLRPELVVEVGYDQVTARRFRHGTTFLRWRPDKAPRQCGFDQLIHELRPAELAAILERNRHPMNRSFR